MPCVMLLLDYWPFCRTPFLRTSDAATLNIPPRNWKFLLIEKLPFFAMSLAESIVTVHAQKASGAIVSFENVSLSLRLGNVITSYVNYVIKFFYPVELAIFYPLPREIEIGQFFFSALCLMVITGLAIHQIKKRPFLFVGWFWFLGTLVPVIGLVQLSGQAMADRYMYLPMIGLLIASGVLIERMIRQFKPRTTSLAVAGAGLILALILTTSVQAFYWRDTLSLYAHAVTVVEPNPFMECEFASQLQDIGQREEALEHYKIALELSPQYDKAIVGMSEVLMDLGKADQAQELLEKAMGSRPKQVNLLEALGKVLQQRKQFSRAATMFALVTELRPQSVEIWCEYASALFQNGETTKAQQAVERAIAIGPRYTQARIQLSQQLRLLGRYAEALTYAQLAYEHEPRSLPVLLELAEALAANGQWEKAAEKIKLYLRVNANSADALVVLARCEMQLGNPTAAMEHLNGAIKIQPDHAAAQALLKKDQTQP